VACPTKLISFNDTTYPLDAFPPPAGNKIAGASHVAASEMPPAIEALLHIADTGAGQSIGKYETRSELFFAFLTLAIRARVSVETIVGACIDEAHSSHAIHEHSIGNGGREYVERQIENARKKVQDQRSSSGGRPTLYVQGGNLSELATTAEDVLVEAAVPFYERSHKLVRPIVTTAHTFEGQKTSAAQLARVEPVYMRDVLGRVAEWFRFDVRAKTWVRTNPSEDMAKTILARAGEWKFLSISGIITAQTMRPDGTILDQLGYDPATRLLLVDPPPMAPIAERPTRDDANAALSVLKRLLTEFPLKSEVDKAVALSILITPVVRGAFDVAPMHVVDAPVAASGKSFMLDVAAAIVSGQRMPVIAAGRTEEETEKRLGSALLASQPLICIDNVNGELGGDALCQIIERPRPQVRILGKSELMDVETRGTSLFANGNNIVIVGDLCRRVVRAQLDPKMEEPELRKFMGNPFATVLADRGNYIAAALTICRAYVVAGQPNLADRLASFEGWSNFVRSALIWLGEKDPVSSMAMSRADDPSRGALRALLSAWAETIGTGYEHRITLKKVIAMIGQRKTETEMTSQGPITIVKVQWPDLSAAVMAVAGDRYQPERALGCWMRGHKNRVVSDVWFENEPDPKGGSEWWVARTDGSSAVGKSGTL
jgi:hypothetical protein